MSNSLPSTGVRRILCLSARFTCRGRRATLLRRGLSAFLCFASATVAFAQLPNPALDTVFPPGGQRGTTVRVAISGRDLDEASRLVFSHPGLIGRQVLREPSEFESGSQTVANQFDVDIPTNLPVGTYDVRAIGRFGVSTPLSFVVGDVAEVIDPGANHSIEKAATLARDTVVSGRADSGGVDHYRFNAEQGEMLVVACVAQAIDSQLQPVLTVWDATGRQIKRSKQLSNPIMAVKIPAAGEYVLGVNDHVYGGGGKHIYRLRIHTGPYVVAVEPSLAQAGQQAQFTLHGLNLVGSSETSSYRLGSTILQQQTKSIYVDHQASLAATQPISADPHSFMLQLPGLNSQPIRVVDHPVTIEVEPNNKPSEAQRVTMPCDISGRFYPRRDQDWFEFAAQKGQAIQIRVISHRQGVPTDPELFVQRVIKANDGTTSTKEVSVQDDFGSNRDRFRGAVRRGLEIAHRDPVVSFTASHEGDYRVGLRDLNGSSLDDPRLHYQLSIGPRQPSFGLVAWVQLQKLDDDKKIDRASMVLRKGGVLPVMIDLFREGGFDGAVRVEARQLPKGVEAAPCRIAAGKKSGILMLSAKENVNAWTGHIEIVGIAQQGDERIEQTASAATLTSSTNNVEQSRPEARMARRHTLAVVAHEPIAAHVDLVPDEGEPNRAYRKVRTCRGAKLSIPVRYVRLAELKGDLGLGVVEAPPHVKIEGLTLKPDTETAELKLELNNDKVQAGSYDFFLRGKLKSLYARNAAAIAAAEAQRKEFDSTVAMLTERVKAAEQELVEKRKAASENAAAIARIEKAIEQNTTSLNAAKQQSQVLQQQIAELTSSSTSVDDQSLNEIKELAATTREHFNKSADILTRLNQKLVAAANQLKSRSEDVAAAESRHRKLAERRKRADAWIKQLDQRLKQAREQQGPKEVTTYVMSDLVRLEVAPSPLDVQVAEGGGLMLERKADRELTFRVGRQFGFEGTVEFRMETPESVEHVSAEVQTLAADMSDVKLTVSVGAEAPLGEHQLLVKYKLDFNGVKIEETLPLSVVITE